MAKSPKHEQVIAETLGLQGSDNPLQIPQSGPPSPPPSVTQEPAGRGASRHDSIIREKLLIAVEKSERHWATIKYVAVYWAILTTISVVLGLISFIQMQAAGETARQDMQRMQQ